MNRETRFHVKEMTAARMAGANPVSQACRGVELGTASLLVMDAVDWATSSLAEDSSMLDISVTGWSSSSSAGPAGGRNVCQPAPTAATGC